MIEENLPEGAYRKEIYACVQSVIKRDLSDAEHKYLSHILKLYANTVAVNRPPAKQAPIEHKWTCTNCATETVAVGKKENEKVVKRAKKNKKNEQVI